MRRSNQVTPGGRWCKKRSAPSAASPASPGPSYRISRSCPSMHSSVADLCCRLRACLISPRARVRSALRISRHWFRRPRSEPWQAPRGEPFPIASHGAGPDFSDSSHTRGLAGGASKLRRTRRYSPQSRSPGVLHRPSKSADIEFNLTLGVHSPQDVQVVLLDEPRSDPTLSGVVATGWKACGRETERQNRLSDCCA
jgi:hypothetical protein